MFVYVCVCAMCAFPLRFPSLSFHMCDRDVTCCHCVRYSPQSEILQYDVLEANDGDWGQSAGDGERLIDSYIQEFQLPHHLPKHTYLVITTEQRQAWTTLFH